ncbi:MAG TPA: glycosyltransferase family 2 protein [Patescibacteria group bacterium]|nr:glycosyltransferase family 2 protein [Patescibacteria group bacterium]
MKVSIIILSWNTKKLLRDCLKSVLAQKPLSLEVIVIDNASSDGSPEMVEKEFKQVKLIRNKENLGFAKANNQGIKIAKGDLIMLLNSDTIVQKGTIKELIDSFQKQDRFKAVSPLLILPNKKPQIDYYMKFPNLWQVFLYHNPVLRPLVLKIAFLRNRICFFPRKEPFEVDQLPGAALIASKKTWDKVGLLDEDFHFLFEDVDWCYRARKLDCQLLVIPEAKIIHLGGASWKKRLEIESFDFYKQYFSSMLLFVEKNYGSPKKLIFRIALIKNWLFSSLFLFPVAVFSPRVWQKVLDKLKLIKYFLIVK